jgi:hypothetical protein
MYELQLRLRSECRYISIPETFNEFIESNFGSGYLLDLKYILDYVAKLSEDRKIMIYVKDVKAYLSIDGQMVNSLT